MGARDSARARSARRPPLLMMGRKRVVAANMRARPEDYAELERLVLTGAVKPVINQVFPLVRAAEAYPASEGGQTRGKILIRLG